MQNPPHTLNIAPLSSLISFLSITLRFYALLMQTFLTLRYITCLGTPFSHFHALFDLPEPGTYWIRFPIGTRSSLQEFVKVHVPIGTDLTTSMFQPGTWL
jgi:hypothetical protein